MRLDRRINRLTSDILRRRAQSAARAVAWLLLTGLLLACQANAEQAPTAEGIEFFEKQVRPILAEQCYSCHSHESKKIKGGLLLDTRDGWLKGGDNGPAIVPGDPNKSLLIKAVRYTDDDLQMPPKGKKLSGPQIAALEEWVRLGAPDPRADAPTNAPALSANTAKARAHWAFQPIREPATPHVKNQRWVQSPLDSFVLTKLEAKGMTPSPRADKRTLIRRLSFDLTGLPPTSREVAAFLADQSSQALPNLVDRLLASPAYGERWGRHWLDVARYADTKGYVFEEERRYPYAYTYRDYVIRALNEDLPYDQFLIQQIAADQLHLGEDKRPLAALGFLTLGRRFLNNQPDIIDDRIDVVARGTMALTVTCARCHDHKFDPIPTRDYYSLYGIFASSVEPAESPLLGGASLPTDYPAYVAEHKRREEEWTSFRDSKEREALAEVRRRTGDYLLTAYEAKNLADASKAEGLARERKLDPGIVHRWESSLEDWAKHGDPVFAAWTEFATLPKESFAEKAPAVAASLATKRDAKPAVNPLVVSAFATNPPTSMKEVADRYGQLLADIDRQWRQTLTAATNVTTAKPAEAPKSFADPEREALRQVLYGADAPGNIATGEIPRLFDVPTAQKTRALKRKLDELDATHPGAPPRAMALEDSSSPHDTHVFLRGNPNNPGPETPRQFLEVLSHGKREPYRQGSGRLQLAQAIANSDNPLTARVIVNRVWMYHFGAGLVRTPSDFGLRSDPPANPELLDYLAARFMADGWSLKKLHRQILLSSAYQQSSDDNPRYALLDPSNQLLWKFNRQRLDFEAMRDSLLAITGRLDPAAGGHSVDITTEPFSTRRTVYSFIERQNLPGLFRAFDLASPDSSSAQRFVTTVPQQALFWMNSPFVIQQLRALLDRPEFKSLTTDEQRIRYLYERAYQRRPDADELRLGLRFLRTSVASPAPAMAEPPTWLYGYGEFDPATKRVTKFERLPQFIDEAWQGGMKMPDDKLAWVRLTAEGGHPGADSRHAAIRRWTAPADGSISIRGTLRHESSEGDGVRARVVSSRAGILGEWTVHDGKQATPVDQTEVHRGDTIDFVTDCRDSDRSDSFLWAPVVKWRAGGNQTPPSGRTEWNAKNDFTGPASDPAKPLNVWEKYAQVLLLSNEVVFVD